VQEWSDGVLQRSFVLDLLLALITAVRVFFRSRTDTSLEILALRQQVSVLKRKHPRPTLNLFDRVFWMMLGRMWSRWTDALVIVKPETVVGWHRLSPLLALAIPPSWTSAEGDRRDQGSHPPHVHRECRLGSTEDSRRNAEARVSHLGKHCRQTPEASPASWRSGKALACHS
jgi:hypothetical protein